MVSPLALVEPPPPTAPSLPQNVEAEAALARRADDRQPAGRGHPAQAPARPFLRAAARPHLRADPEADRPQHDRQPGDAAAAVRGGRGDEGAGRPGLSRPADRQRRRDHRRARLRRADLRPGAAARAGRRRPRDGRAGARHQRGGRSQGPDRGGRGGALPGRRGRRRRGPVKSFAAGDPHGRRRWPKRRSTPAAAFPASPPGSTASTPRPAASTTAT